MAVSAPSEGASGSLAAILQQAGAVFATRRGHQVAIDYGSAAGELAVCVSAVGLVNRSELTKLEIVAPAEQLSELCRRLAGDDVAPGGAIAAAAAWWCGAAADRVIVLCDPAVGARVRERLRTEARHHAALTVTDRSVDWAAIELLGHRTAQVLRVLGVYGESGDPRAISPFTSAPIGRVPASWLLKSDRRALALVPTQAAGQAWALIEQAGRPFGISCVGWDAASRYELIERGSRLP